MTAFDSDDEYKKNNKIRNLSSMSTVEKSLSANAPEFVPIFGSDGRRQAAARDARSFHSTTTVVATDLAVNDLPIKPKKKKTKDERSAQRKRRHRRGKSDVNAADLSPTRSLKRQDKNVLDEAQYDSPSRRETPSHHKSKSEGNISMWFDEMKERRLSRFREARDIYGGLDDSDSGDTSAAHISLVFSQPQEWVFGNSVPSIDENVQLLENEDYLAENLERKRWQDWAQSAVRLTYIAPMRNYTNLN